MKNMFKVFGTWLVVGVGYASGLWLWERVLKDKANNLLSRLSKKD